MRLLLIALPSVIACREPMPAPPPPVAVPTIPVPAAPPAPDPAPKSPVWIGMRPDRASTRVLQVVHGAPAERAGMKLGDEIVSIGGHAVTSGTEVITRIRALPANKTAPIVVRRDGLERVLTVVPEDRPAPDAMQASFVGKPAPDVALADAGGGPTIKVGDLRGHVVVLEFWATWCGPCAITAPHLDAWNRELGSAGVRVIGVSDEAAAEVQKYIADHKLGYAFALDPDDAATTAYLVQGLPTIIVIDRGGIVRFSQIGVPDFDALEALIKQLL